MAVKRSGTGLNDLKYDKKSIASRTVKAVDTRNAAADNARVSGSTSAMAETGRTAERAITKWNRSRFEDQSQVAPAYKWR